MMRDGRAGHPRLALLGAVATLAISMLALAAPAQAFIYYASGAGIGRANPDGTGARGAFVRLPENDEVTALTVDKNHIYWVVSGGVIGRADIDGTNVDRTFVNAVANGELAVDDNYIYWADDNLGGIGRAALANPKDINTQFVTGIPSVFGVSTVPAKLGYLIAWTSSPQSSTQTIGIVNNDGTVPNNNFITNGNYLPGTTDLFGLTSDAAHLYWTNYGFNGTIGRSNLDGSDVQANFISGISTPWTVAVDNAHIYWLTIGAPNSPGTRIGRANLDGSGVNSHLLGVEGEALTVDSRTVSCAGQEATIVGTGRSEKLRGTDGDDVISAGPGDDTVLGLGGDDLVCGGAGDDVLRGHDGDDSLRGGTGNDQAKGGAGEDDCHGQDGSDRSRHC